MMCADSWKELLQARVDTHGCAEVARELGVSRPAVSLLLHGKYPGSTERMAERILNTYGTLECPHSGRILSRGECAELDGQPLPTSSPAALRQWRACRHCILNPNKKK